MFKASSNKEKIIAALNSQVNQELVQQLTSYLDQPYKRLVVQKLNQDNKSDEKKIDFSDEENLSMKDLHNDTSHSDERSHASRSGGFSHLPDMNELSKDLPDMDDVSDESDSTSQVDENESSSVEESTIINKSYVSSCTEIPVDMIVDSLNTSSNTSGSVRGQIKEQEIWIYFNDDVNLNTKMSDVINFLVASGYSYLEFNRLARKDNAMVFDITTKKVM